MEYHSEEIDFNSSYVTALLGRFAEREEYHSCQQDFLVLLPVVIHNPSAHLRDLNTGFLWYSESAIPNKINYFKNCEEK